MSSLWHHLRETPGVVQIRVPQIVHETRPPATETAWFWRPQDTSVALATPVSLSESGAQRQDARGGTGRR
ncbi:hypothetical protein CTA1_7816 [Colletotrichum tanaceti]|uniref:Uncharacterized protein n=1 Tax=Colletotrichum tanaceti TaxID=1306861 RepID=A0A4U6XNR9_9PEZI|nr:hypothetical protein CTA1_7816 [Colletotrichum tanaceti]